MQKFLVRILPAIWYNRWYNIIKLYTIYTYVHNTHNKHYITRKSERLLTLYSNSSILCIIVHYISSYTLVYSGVISHSITDYKDTSI